MSHKFELIITTPEKQVFNAEVDSVSLPTVTGQITVLAHHLPLSTIIRPGEMIIRQEGKEEPYAIAGGFIEVQPKQVIVLADTAEHITEIDEAKAQAAIEQAKKTQADMNASGTEYNNLVAKLERDLNRINIVKKYRHRGHAGIPYEGVKPD